MHFRLKCDVWWEKVGSSPVGFRICSVKSYFYYDPAF